MGMEAAVIGSAAIGALGNKANKQKNGGQVDPYTFFPEVKDAIKTNVLPRAAELANTPYPALPMRRAIDPANDPFASRALFELQMAKDFQAKNAKPNIPAPAQNAPADALKTLREELMGAQNAGGAMPFGLDRMTPKTVTNVPGMGYIKSQKPPMVGGKAPARWYSLTPEQQAILSSDLATGKGTANFKSRFGFDPYQDYT